MSNKTNQQFFNDVSDFYDEMINFDTALERKTNFLKNFITDNIKTAADIGCGSGIDSIALSSHGLSVTGFDSSDKMIKISKENSEKLQRDINFYNYSAQNIPDNFNSKFDFICSLGNTIANIAPQDLGNTIIRFSELLNNKGKLLLHILNYEKIIEDNKRIINIKRGKDNYIIRFYDFEKDFINFNILKFAINDPNQRHIISTKVYPHTLITIKKSLKENNFSSIKFFADLKKTPYSSDTSNDIFIYCTK